MGKSDSPSTEAAAIRPRFPRVLLLSAWCGLVAGLLEVGAIVLRKQTYDPDHLYKMSRHFVWMIPMVDVGVFLALGFCGYGVVRLWPSRGGRLFARVMAAMTVLPALLVAVPQIFTLAWLLVALGLAVRLVPLVERRSRGFRRLVMVSFPMAIVLVAGLAASLWVSDWTRHVRERARPLPPPGSPNVLLIVMDTVAAGHLSSHGYSRATSPCLVELAERGIRFDSARRPHQATLSPKGVAFATDAYDDCIADLDEQLGAYSMSWTGAGSWSKRGSSSLRTTVKALVSTQAFSATARVFTRPKCMFRSSSYRRREPRRSGSSKSR